MSTFNRNEEVQIYHNAINLYGEAIQTIVAIEQWVNTSIDKLKMWQNQQRRGRDSRCWDNA